MSLFYPNIYQKNILSIDYKKLKEKGIRLLIYDLDNTIISYETNILDKEIIDLFQELKKSFQIVVLSNTTNPNKIKNICNTLNIEYIKFACKPFFLGFYKIKRKYNVSYDKMCMIGDQFLTDIYGSNKLGLTSCLINKISDVEGKYTKFKRKIEKRIIKSLYKKYNFERGKYYD